MEGKILRDDKWQPNPEQAVNKQPILEVIAEGGSITLYGLRSAGCWQFRVETNEAAMDIDEEMPDVPKRPWVDSWYSALEQLDRYPWPQLYPRLVHPEFGEPIFEALQVRKAEGKFFDWSRWRHVLRRE